MEFDNLDSYSRSDDVISIDDALELRGRIFGAFELAELARTPAERERALTFVVVGAEPQAGETVADRGAAPAYRCRPPKKSPSGEGPEGCGVASRQPPVTPDQNLALMRV